GFTWNITSDGASNSTSLYVVLRGLVADPVSTGSSIPQSPVRPKFRNRRSPPGCSGHRTIASPRGPEPLHPSRWLPSWPEPARPVAPTEDTTRKTGRVAPMHAPSPRRTSHIGRVPHVPLRDPVLPAREAPTRPRLLPATRHDEPSVPVTRYPDLAWLSPTARPEVPHRSRHRRLAHRVGRAPEPPQSSGHVGPRAGPTLAGRS